MSDRSGLRMRHDNGAAELDDELGEVLARPRDVRSDVLVGRALGADAPRQGRVGVRHAPLIVLEGELLVVGRDWVPARWRRRGPGWQDRLRRSCAPDERAMGRIGSALGITGIAVLDESAVDDIVSPAGSGDQTTPSRCRCCSSCRGSGIRPGCWWQCAHESSSGRSPSVHGPLGRRRKSHCRCAPSTRTSLHGRPGSISTPEPE